MSVIQISDQIFPLAQACLTAYIGMGQNGWRVSWSIELAAKPQEVNGHEWAPKISSHSFDVDLRRAYTAEIDVELPPSEDGEAAFLIYIFEHEPVQRARLKVSKWHTGVVSFQLTGSVGAYADEEYGGDLPMRAECTLKLAGVIVDEYHFAKAEERLSQFFDRSLFGLPERCANNGVIFNLATDA